MVYILGGKMNMKRVIKRNPRYQEYLEYIDKHRIGVMRAWDEILRPYLEENHPVNLSKIDKAISEHDISKYDAEEFNAYCNYFYPSEGFDKDEAEFDLAWLHHQHKNPHHPQYWVLVRDSGEIVALDMPFEYVCEMLCDWHSFSLRDPKSTAYKWWNDNKEKMTLSENTIKTIDTLIDVFKEPLEQLDVDEDEE